MKKIVMSLMLLSLAGIASAQTAKTPAPDGKPRTEASSATDSAAKSANREQTRTCNNQAKEQKLKGKERRQFLRTCMKGTSNTTSYESKGSTGPVLQTPKP
ncbi:PsiF family protein [Lacisediminimonas profundi]|uniref:PsiF family protein n=1 Tax=Lacisediminimonas profundi TaxID=2603856 RepID=UPI00124AF152|nr:PsiF family protein [Lacisediminimonas profundi]